MTPDKEFLQALGDWDLFSMNGVAVTTDAVDNPMDASDDDSTADGTISDTTADDTNWKLEEFSDDMFDENDFKNPEDEDEESGDFESDEGEDIDGDDDYASLFARNSTGGFLFEGEDEDEESYDDIDDEPVYQEQGTEGTDPEMAKYSDEELLAASEATVNAMVNGDMTQKTLDWGANLIERIDNEIAARQNARLAKLRQDVEANSALDDEFEMQEEAARAAERDRFLRGNRQW